MTAVAAAEPPRLPVRDRAAARTRATAGLSPMLSRLAAERATGILSRERGTLHLAEGRVVHAESPAAPGLDVLLTAHGTLDTTAWREAADRAGDRNDAGRLLVDSGRIAAGALELCHLAALYDAAYFALAPSSTPGRFRYGGAYPPGVFRPVTVTDVERETLRRRQLLHRVWPDPLTDSAPLTRPAHAGAAPALPPRQQAVLDRVDGVRTAPDIARQLGRPAFHTLVDVRRLAAAGLVAPEPGHHAPARAVTPPVPEGTPPTAVGTPPTAEATPSAADGIPPEFTDPDITLLKRLRDALEAL